MSFLKALNEAFDNYKCDECNELNESGKHFDLLMALKAARETLQRDGNNNLKAYEIAYQNVLEDYFPDKSWWEVTDCNIFWDLMETRDPEQTEINIIKGIHDDVDESCNESIWGNYKEFDPKDGWTEDDIDFYKTIDWSKSNHGEYEVDDDFFEDNVVAYGFDEPRKRKAKFVKVYRQNPIYPPYYRPKDEPFTGVVGPMADGRKRNGYDVHDRYETQSLYDRLSEARNPEHDEENEIIKRVYEPGRRKYSDVKKDIKKLGYELEVDSDARKTFGRDYFGDKVKITNPKTGREIVGSQNATWKKDRFLRAGKNYMDYPGYNKDNKNSNRDEFDYKGFLDKPLGWKPSTEKSTVQQFKDDKKLVKDNQRVLDAADRLSKVRDRMAARKTNESLKVVDEVSLKDFNFRPEAADRLKYLTDDQILQLESALEDMYPEGMTADQLNEFVWFEDDTIAEILGFEDFDEVMEQGVQR